MASAYPTLPTYDEATGSLGTSSTTSYIDERRAREYLTSMEIHPALQSVFINSLGEFRHRFLVIDDSGSMGEMDGHLSIKTKDGAWKTTKCSRWNELAPTCRFLCTLAHLSRSPLEVRLLNGSPSPLLLGCNGPSTTAQEAQGLSKLMNVFDRSPNGGTPLCFHVQAIVQTIIKMAPELRASNQRALVIICTDGEASDGNLADALKPLQNLPVNVIVRLCTNNNRILNYWMKIDKEIEVPMDLLDDLVSEATEVQRNNSWLSYDFQMHALRTLGSVHKEMDLLNERRLSPIELRNFFAVVFGNNTLPSPMEDWHNFENNVRDVVIGSNLNVVDALSHTLTPMINLERLPRCYHELSGAPPLPLLATGLVDGLRTRFARIDREQFTFVCVTIVAMIVFYFGFL